MIIEYDNEEIESFIKHGLAESQPYRKWKSNKELRINLDKVMVILHRVESCDGLRCYKSLNYEPLKYDLKGLSSVRIGYKTKFRLEFEELDYGIRIKVIEISEHYGDK